MMSQLSQMSRRERLMVLGAGVLVLLTLVYLGIVEPYRGAIGRLDSKVRNRQKQLTEVVNLRSQFLQLQRRQAELDRRINANPGFSVFSFIETTAVQTALKPNLVSVRPQPPVVQDQLREESVEIRLEKIALNQLLRFLYSVEHADALVQVKSLRVKTRFDNRAQLDATLTIAAYGRSS